ncbi:MAG: RidA family protein [Novosphingobium sp.]
MSDKPPLSKVRIAGPTVYVSGQLPRGADGAIIAGSPDEQVRQTLHNLEQALAAAGCTLGDVVKVTAWLTDACHMADFNRVYREFFAEPFPARATLVSALVVPDAMVEIEAVAYREGASG